MDEPGRKETSSLGESVRANQGCWSNLQKMRYIQARIAQMVKALPGARRSQPAQPKPPPHPFPPQKSGRANGSADPWPEKETETGPKTTAQRTGTTPCHFPVGIRDTQDFKAERQQAPCQTDREEGRIYTLPPPYSRQADTDVHMQNSPNWGWGGENYHPEKERFRVQNYYGNLHLAKLKLCMRTSRPVTFFV